VYLHNTQNEGSLKSWEQQAIAPDQSSRVLRSILNGESFASAQLQKTHRESGPQPSQRLSAHV
jgi:hypothetical protein